MNDVLVTVTAIILSYWRQTFIMWHILRYN